MSLEVEESLTHDPEGINFLRKNRIYRSKGADGRTKKSGIPGSNKQKLCRLRKILVILTNQLRGPMGAPRKVASLDLTSKSSVD